MISPLRIVRSFWNKEAHDFSSIQCNMPWDLSEEIFQKLSLIQTPIQIIYRTLQLGYVKPGVGKKYDGRKDFSGRKVNLESAVFSGNDNRKTELLMF
jgi:hypothetical protein